MNSLSQTQKTNLRNAFELIDQDKDGNITKDDLVKLYNTLDSSVDESIIEGMLSFSDTNSINFTKFLGIMSGELSKLSMRSELYKALKVFSKDINTQELEINVKELKDNLLENGLTELQFDEVTHGFTREEMNGNRVFQATRWVETYIDN